MQLEQLQKALEEKHAKQLAEDLRVAQNTHEAVTKLQAAGLAHRGVDSHNFDWFSISVYPKDYERADGRNFFKNTKKDTRELSRKLNEFRKALGVPLRMISKSVLDGDKRIIAVTLKAEGYDSIRIYYYKKLKSGGKCRIQRTRRTSDNLVCSIG